MARGEKRLFRSGRAGKSGIVAVAGARAAVVGGLVMAGRTVEVIGVLVGVGFVMREGDGVQRIGLVGVVRKRLSLIPEKVACVGVGVSSASAGAGKTVMPCPGL